MYEPKNYERLLGTPGFSDQLLKNHFTLYEGYVKNTNTLVEKLQSFINEEKAGTPEYNELKRRFGWEYNGMRLHELYFGNMSKTESVTDSVLREKIAKVWGSTEVWEKDFKATGAMRGIGWAILAQDSETGQLFNIWVNEHDEGHLAGAKPLLVMDVFEHAFMLDYGLKRADYISAFWRSIDWQVVTKRSA